MTDYEITAISVEGAGTHAQHITHVWGSFGWKDKQTAVEEIWKSLSGFHVRSGLLRVEVEAVPKRPFGNVANALMIPHKPYLRTMPDGTRDNNLMRLPQRLPPNGLLSNLRI